ncbi:MAG: hypothetical protein JWL69_352 [Phycisphaerales bacterium]|jgi:Skp family chaperone for outer membrane proteins|nr:hypothetical protein [Phycisphaerales bacterium]MDB5355651.1 hypothetical protein [Phycisphaerales bacterium]
MKFRNVLSLLLVGVLASAAAAAPEQSTKVAAANPSRILAEMQEAKDLMEKMAAKDRELSAAGQQKKAAADDLHRQLQESGLKPGSPQAMELSEKADAADADLQSWVATNRAKADREKKFLLKGMYDKIEAAVADVAKQEGIDLVVTDNRQEPKNLEKTTSDELAHLLGMRSVLFASKNADITEKVIAVLDKNYAASKK